MHAVPGEQGTLSRGGGNITNIAWPDLAMIKFDAGLVK